MDDNTSTVVSVNFSSIVSHFVWQLSAMMKKRLYKTNNLR